jgi:hypothetical protein
MGHVLFEYRHDGLWECEEETAAAVVIRSIGVEFWYRHFGMCRFFLTARWSRGISFVQICSSLLGGEAGFLKRGEGDLAVSSCACRDVREFKPRVLSELSPGL